jgi:hypothetical protein
MADNATCKADKCEKEVKARGYCARHFAKWKRGEMPKPRYTVCNAENCRKPRARRGLCAEHFAKEYPGKKSVEGVAAAAPSAAAAAPEAAS